MAAETGKGVTQRSAVRTPGSSLQRGTQGGVGEGARDG